MVRACSNNSADVGESMVVCGKRKVPQEGQTNSKLRCEETNGRAHVWWAFLCEVKYRQWCKLDAVPSEHALRKAVAACRRNPRKEQSLPNGSTDARCAMLRSGTDGVACRSPWRTGSLYQSDGYMTLYCSSNAFLLGVASLAQAQRDALIAGSTSHMLDGEFAKLVNETTSLHLTHSLC